MTVQEILDSLEQDPTRPAELAYFDKFFRRFIEDGREVVRSGGRKVIGIYCMSVPEELIYAAGALPVRLCSGSADAAEAGESYLPEVSCPMVKAAAGFSAVDILPLYQDCDLVVIPATCDWKVKLGEIISEFVPVMMLDLPRIKNLENSRLFWYREILRLKKKLKKVTKKRITRKRLRSAAAIVHGAQIEFNRFRQIRQKDIHVISGRDAIAVMNAYFFDDAQTWTAAMAQLNDALEKRVTEKVRVTPESAPRILLTGSPVVFPNWKIPDLIESTGGALVCDELCTSNRYLGDMFAMDEMLTGDILHGLADRYLLPCTCPIFSDTIDRRNRLLQMIEDYKIEGVVHHILKGCHPYDVELGGIEWELNKKSISQLKIETDYNPEDTEQIRTRMEAFIETLKGRRR
jgi:benzoyl-CoA reductase/2-hydroxyglutaryl-CoA dehydratase subunit BcrC/BadD/HgdB